MLHVGIFNVCLTLLCLYAMRSGGQPERLATLCWALACLATLLLPFDHLTSFRGVEWGELAIDTALLIAFMALTAWANRYWPIWVSALHLLAIGIHGVKGYLPDLLPSIYAAAEGKIGYLITAILGIGVWRHQVRLQRHAHDDDWVAKI